MKLYMHNGKIQQFNLSNLSKLQEKMKHTKVHGQS